MKRAIFILATVLMLFGCGFYPESNFRLASDSRLPKWVTIPAGYTRSDVLVRIDFYLGSKVKFWVYCPTSSKKILMQKDGVERLHPISQEQFKRQGNYAFYPNYSIITVDGIEEVYAHAQKGDILSITDNPK